MDESGRKMKVLLWHYLSHQTGLRSNISCRDQLSICDWPHSLKLEVLKSHQSNPSKPSNRGDLPAKRARARGDAKYKKMQTSSADHEQQKQSVNNVEESPIPTAVPVGLSAERLAFARLPFQIVGATVSRLGQFMATTGLRLVDEAHFEECVVRSLCDVVRGVFAVGGIESESDAPI
jgi:hypothetical protein